MGMTYVWMICIRLLHICISYPECSDRKNVAAWYGSTERCWSTAYANLTVQRMMKLKACECHVHVFITVVLLQQDFAWHYTTVLATN